MLSSQKPKLIPVAFATSGAKQDIPVASQVGVTPGRASYTDGFPPLTRTPLSAGGIPPYGTDFNGVLNEISAAIRWANAGMGYTYDAAFSTSVGGYPKGAQLTKSTNDGIWLNTVESNTSNPDTGGAGWVDMTGGRLIGEPKVFTASGTYTPSKGTRYVIVEAVGGGGGGGGVSATTSSTAAVSGGGGSGGYLRAKLDVSTIGATVSISVGTGGAGGIGDNSGGQGGDTSLASYVIAPGGLGGTTTTSSSASAFIAVGGSPGGDPTGGNVVSAKGSRGAMGIFLNASTAAVGGDGAASPLGGGGIGSGSSGTTGTNGSGFGSGGGGSARQPSSSAANGYSGAPGVIIIHEYS